MRMNFEEDIRKLVLASLSYDPSTAQELAAKDAHDLFMIYINWTSRQVAPRPRLVHLSYVLKSNPLFFAAEYRPALDEIVSKLRRGEDITPNLSRGIKTAYESQKKAKRLPLRKRRDLDLLLNDWGVHHLHLSTEIELDGFVKRTGPLLFAIFRPNDAYLIDLVDHGGWTREQVIRTIANEWPEAGIVYQLNGVVGLSCVVSDADRIRLRNAGINCFCEFDGKVFAPAGGLTAAGTSVRSIVLVDTIFDFLDQLSDKLECKQSFLSKLMEMRGLTLPESPDLHFIFFPDGSYGVVETQTGFQLKLHFRV